MSQKVDDIAGKKNLLSEDTRSTIDHWAGKFPADRSAPH